MGTRRGRRGREREISVPVARDIEGMRKRLRDTIERVIAETDETDVETLAEMVHADRAWTGWAKEAAAYLWVLQEAAKELDVLPEEDPKGVT